MEENYITFLIMEDYRFGKQDLYKIFIQVLKNISYDTGKYNDYIKDHHFKNNYQTYNIYKKGLCVLIRNSIYDLYPEIGRDYRHLLEERCEEIIYKATNIKFPKKGFYWNKFNFADISVEEWYEPRIKCIKDTIKYLEEI